MPVNPQLIPMPTIKKWAKTLQKTLPEVVSSADSLSLSQSQEILARLLSFKNWHALNSTYKNYAPSLHIKDVKTFKDLFLWAKKNGLGRLSLSIDTRTEDSMVHVFDSLLNTKDIIFSFPLNSKDFSNFLLTFLNPRSDYFHDSKRFMEFRGSSNKPSLFMLSRYNHDNTLDPNVYEGTLLHFPYTTHPSQKQVTIFLHTQEERLHQPVDSEIASVANRIKSSIRSVDNETAIFHYASFSPEALEQDLWQLAEHIGSSCGAMIGPHSYMNLSASFYPLQHFNLSMAQDTLESHDVLIFNTDSLDIPKELISKLVSQGKIIVLAGVCSNRLLLQSKMSDSHRNFNQKIDAVFCYYDSSTSTIVRKSNQRF